MPRAPMSAPPFLQRLHRRPEAELRDGEFPCTLPFVRDLDLRFEAPVTIFVGENGSGKSTVIEAIAELCGLPVGGGGRNELAGQHAPQGQSELGPFIRAAFLKKPREGYFFRAEYQAHFATLLDERSKDPAFGPSAYARYGGRSLHTRSHGEAFLTVLASWMTPGMIVMDEPESALSPQRQLSLLVQIARLARDGGSQFVIATHSPLLMTYPGASLFSFDGGAIEPTRIEDTSHFQITKGLLENPGRYWKHLLNDDSTD